MEKKVYDLVVDPELERVAPPLAENELLLLTEDILEHGCKFPLIVWGNTIVDGHNRFRICKENSIPFGIEQMEFADKTEARLWIVRNQLGRRNLSDFQRCEMVLPLEEVIRAEAKKRMSSKTREVGKKIFSGQSRDIMADMAGVSFPTLKWAKVLTAEADDETLEKLRRGDLKIHTAYIAIRRRDTPEKSEEEQKQVDHEKPPVVAARLEGPIPFEPVQRDMPKGNKRAATDMHQPLTQLDEPLEVPAMRDAPEKTPYPFPYVKDQVRFAVKNLMKELEIAMNWLRDEDKNNVDELLQILDDGFDQAESLIKEATA